MNDLTQEQVHDKYFAEEKRKGEIENLELEIVMAEKRIKKGDAYLRLEKNPDYLLVIQEGFCTDLAQGAIKGLGRGNIEKDSLHSVLSAVGHLQTNLEGILQLALEAKMALPQMKDQLSHLKTVSS